MMRQHSASFWVLLLIAAAVVPGLYLLFPGFNPFLYLGILALTIITLAAAVYCAPAFLALAVFISQFKAFPVLQPVQTRVDLTVAVLSIVLLIIILRSFLMPAGDLPFSTGRFAGSGKQLGAFLCFACVIALSYAYTSAPESGGIELVRFLFIGGLLFFAPLYLIRSEKHFRQFAASFVIMGLVLSCALFLRVRTVTSSEDVDVTLIGAGWLIGTAIMFVIFYRFIESDSWRKLAMIVCLPILVAGLITSASRGAIFATAVAFTFTSLILRSSKNKLMLAGVGVLIVLCGAVSLYFLRNMGNGKYREKVDELVLLSHGKETSGSAGKRLEFYRSALREIPQHPILGLGLSGWSTYYYGKDERAYPHDLFLEVAVEQGVIGLLALGTFLVVLFVGVRDLRRLSGDYFIVLFSALVLTITAAAFSGNLDDDRILWLWSGMLLAVGSVVRSRFAEYLCLRVLPNRNVPEVAGYQEARR